MNRCLLFLVFFISGFCGLVYQVIWTRLAFASFGIIAPVLSVVISVFMLGLALGSWAGGRWIEPLTLRTGHSALAFYGCAEFLIGLSAFAVPACFAFGHRLLLTSGGMGSFRYLLLSALVLGLAVLPWCVLMGTTFPFMLAFLKERGEAGVTPFSGLYVPNVLGAMAGTLMTALVFVELFGFRKTLLLAAAGNFLIAGISFLTVWRARGQSVRSTPTAIPPSTGPAAGSVVGPNAPQRLIPWILFWTGFASMGMEVVWFRSFAPVVKTQVYSFALVLATYLGATFLGSVWYRWHLRKNNIRPTVWSLLLLINAVLLPILLNDVHLVHPSDELGMASVSVAILLSSIVPFCGLLGYLTPQLIDGFGRGSPSRAGTAYAVNVVGCILGPLFVSYVLLPRVAERHALVLLGVPFFALYLACRGRNPGVKRCVAEAIAVVALLASTLYARDFEASLGQIQRRFEVRRDYAASVVSYGGPGHERLLVNGIGMSALTPITKFMAHLPLAFHKTRPRSALIICFGMGTSYRSALSWDVETTTVELVPGVRDAFGFYHADAAACLANPKGRIVIDDGRRFLLRTREKFDVIVVDPPPPVEAAGTSLLYSTEFYALAKQHLNPGGILQAWIPLSAGPTVEAAVRSLRESFPHVRSFGSIQRRGRHLLASLEPIENLDAAELAARFPVPAASDLMEWSSAADLKSYLQSMLVKEVPFEKMLNPDKTIRLTDDQPYNEYFLLRGAK